MAPSATDVGHLLTFPGHRPGCIRRSLTMRTGKEIATLFANSDLRCPALISLYNRRGGWIPDRIPFRALDVTVPKDARSKRFGVEQELPKGRPRTIMLALTATYYTPGARF